MTAYGYKQTSRGLRQRVRFTPKTGHPRWNVCFSVEGMLDP